MAEQDKDGLAYNIVNIAYPGMLDRTSTAAFMDTCHTVFNKYFGFTSPKDPHANNFREKVYRNVTKNDLNQLLNKCVTELKTRPYNKVAVTISSHGEFRNSMDQQSLDQQYVRCVPPKGSDISDTDLYPIDELLKKFSTPDLSKVQKIFIFQVCRAEVKGEGLSTDEERFLAEDRGVTIELVDNSDDEGTKVAEVADRVPQYHSSGGPKIPPCIPESVVVFASPEGKNTYSSQMPRKGMDFQGGWLPLALYDVLYERQKSLQNSTELTFNFLDLLHEVNATVSKLEFNDKGRKLKLKAAATFYHQLTNPIMVTMKRKDYEDDS